MNRLSPEGITTTNLGWNQVNVLFVEKMQGII